jgi:hypothetical protein
MSPMLAPLASSARITVCSSSSVSPAIGSGSSAEPPPENKRGFDDFDASAWHCVAVARR